MSFTHNYLSPEDTPDKLYRGMKFDDKTFIRFNLHQGLTMPPEHVNENGETVISDGQEYGLYMSNELGLADVYTGRPAKSTMGGRLMSDVILGQTQRICMPTVGVMYEIDTDGLNLRRPNLTTFKGHQAALGDEYISDTDIPPSNVHLKFIHISPDVVHDGIDIRPDINAKHEARFILEKREEHLEQMAFDLEKLDAKRLRVMSFSPFSSEHKVLKKLYGDEELAFKSPDDMPKGTDEEIRDYLLCNCYKKNGLDFKTMCGIVSSNKAIENFKAMSAQKIALDPTLDAGYELEMQKRAGMDTSMEY